MPISVRQTDSYPNVKNSKMWKRSIVSDNNWNKICTFTFVVIIAWIPNIHPIYKLVAVVTSWAKKWRIGFTQRTGMLSHPVIHSLTHPKHIEIRREKNRRREYRKGEIIAAWNTAVYKFFQRVLRVIHETGKYWDSNLKFKNLAANRHNNHTFYFSCPQDV